MSIYYIDGQVVDRVDCGSPADFDNLFAGGGTVMSWIYVLNYGSNGYGRIFDKADNNDSDYGWCLSLDDSTDSIRFVVGFRYWLIFWLQSHGSWRLPVNFMDDKFNSWHHVAVTYNSDSASNNPIIYFDGVSQSVTETATPATEYRGDSSQNLKLGNSTSQNRTLWGYQEDARIYTRTLSANEIETIYNSRGVDGIVYGLVGRFQLGAGAQGIVIPEAAIIQDVSEQKHNGIAYSSPQWQEGLVKRRRRVA